MAVVAQHPASMVRRHTVTDHRRSSELTDRQATFLFKNLVEVHRETLIHDPGCGCCSGLLERFKFGGFRRDLDRRPRMARRILGGFGG